MGFGEFAVLLLVAMVVLGPKELPRYMRMAGKFAGRARDWANDMRRKSGIDEVLRMEGLDKDFAEFRKLTRGEFAGLSGTVRSVMNGATLGPYAEAQPQAHAAPAAPPPAQLLPAAVTVDLEREYPIDGPDSYDALPDTAVIPETLAPSPLADDPVYARGAAPTPAPESATPPGSEPRAVGNLEAHS
jgi:sec-independent protein translocase protein TatB